MEAREDVVVRVDVRRGGIHVEIERAAFPRISRGPGSRQEDAGWLVLNAQLDPDLVVLVDEHLLDLLARLVAGCADDRQRGTYATFAPNPVRALYPACLVELVVGLLRVVAVLWRARVFRPALRVAG